MNHLCTDLDSLFNSKKNDNSATNVSLKSNGSKNSSFSSLNFEFDDDILDDFTSLNQYCRITTPFRESDRPKTMNLFLNEKSTQTTKIQPRMFTIKKIKRITNKKINSIFKKVISF